MPMPPHCPPFIVADRALYDRYQDYVARFGSGERRPRGAELDEARELALTLHRNAMNQGHSKAHELSPDIPWLDHCAAIVECIAFGRDTPAFRDYASHVLYYRAFADHLPWVNAFLAYVEALGETQRGAVPS